MAYSLNDEIDVAGEWWDSENLSTRTYGRLTFSRDGGVNLVVNQSFEPPHITINASIMPRYKCVYGVTEKGEAVTLIDSQQFQASIHLNTGGMTQPATMNARMLLMGGHIPYSFLFSNMHFTIANFQLWLSQIAITEEVKREPFSVIHCFKKMPNDEFYIPKIHSNISILNWYRAGIDRYSSSHISVEAGFNIKPTTPQKMDWFLEQNNTFTTLVSFLAGRIMQVDAITSDIDNSQISVLFRNKKSARPKQNNELNYFLRPPSISIHFHEYCKEWFDVFPKINGPANLARSVMASEGLWLHVKFLLLIQALEGFHRSLYGGNWTRLQKRLDDLKSPLSDKIQERIFGPTKTIPPKWVDTRNYYTHWNEDLKSKIMDEQEIYYANIQLSHFLNTLFMLLVKVPPSDIENAFSESSKPADDLRFVIERLKKP